MKKISAILVAAVLSVSLTACGRTTDNNTNTDNIDSTSYRVGIGSYTTTDSSYSSVEGEHGKSVVNTTYATVIFDENDIIRKVYIDQVESKVLFDANGQLVTEGTDTNIRSKRELGDEYNMKPASPLGKEWYEQVNSIESWLVGKNIRDIANGVMSNNMYGNNGYTDSVTGGVEGVADGIVDGAEDIVSDITEGAESMTDSLTDHAGSNTNGTIGSNTTDSSYNNNAASDDMSGSTNDSMSGGTSSGSNGYAVNWDEDLKAFATIDTTDIQIVLQKAYANAR